MTSLEGAGDGSGERIVAKVDYDAARGLERLLTALDGLDPRAPDILASHIALEREVEVVLERTLTGAHHLATLGYAQKARVLAACWAGEKTDADNVLKVLLAFGELRNKVAHGNSEVIDQKFKALQQAYLGLYPYEQGTSPADIAGGIISFFGDAPTPAEIRMVAEGLERIEEDTAKHPRAER
jgi:hypothetical protein